MAPFAATCAPWIVALLAFPSGSGTRQEQPPTVRVHRDGVTRGAIPAGMVVVPEGKFRMGTTWKSVAELAANDPGVSVDRLVAMAPDHEVALATLLIDREEVQNVHFRRYLEARALAPSRELLDLAWFRRERGGRKIDGLDAAAERLPLRGVSGDEAADCARWLGKRLPTEEEWEYAARRGRPADGFYPWGTGWSAWASDRCANAQSTMVGRSSPSARPGGSFPSDRSFDELLDLCGNVAEWTSSPFAAYEGYDAEVAAKALGEKRRLEPRFDDIARTIRGGSAWGNRGTNSLLFRFGAERTARFEAVGFRCAMSAVAGRDALAAARASLGKAFSAQGDALDLAEASIAAETLHPADPALPGARARHLAFARVVAAGKAGTLKMRRDSIDAPRLVGLLTLSEPARAPALAAGDYAVRFKARGQPTEPHVGARDRREPPKRGSAADLAPPPPPNDRDVLLLVDAQGRTAAWLPVTSSDSPALPSRLDVKATADGQLATFAASLPTGNRMSALRLGFELRFDPDAYAPTE